MDFNAASPSNNPTSLSVDYIVGKRLKDLRTRRFLSLRILAERSGLNINTLSLIENGKSSPSVSTLQQLALALDVPIAAFFESEPIQNSIVFTQFNERPTQVFGTTKMQNLGKDLVKNAVQPFVVTLQPGMGSGERMIVHTGFEFVYCLSGSVHYQVAERVFSLHPGDSLVFEAHMPHCWENRGDNPGQILLVFFPADERENPGGEHFSIEVLKKELNMKVAAITDDGKTISQHFGRAPYYLVLSIEEGKITGREMRSKLGHNHFHDQENAGDTHNTGHGMDSASHDKHVNMAQAISDCKALLCGGMGMGAYESMRRLSIQPVVTDIQDIDEAVQAFIDGKLIDHTELLH
jgi:transcriptional regulator with XRE-family HTH domain/predicted Fe-Mo cluster-binding NifX family protein/quercetin dioxygenase-like cupin family protein